jgi:hypothetical protein
LRKIKRGKIKQTSSRILKVEKTRKFIKFNSIFKPVAKLIQLGIQVAITTFLQKPRKRLGQGQSVGYIQRGMLQQGFDIAYLNNTHEIWEGKLWGEKN